MRTLIIGDIHGCYAELLELFDAAALATDDLVVSVGDLVDRGPDPGPVVQWFRARHGAVVLMGNHERKHVRNTFSYSQEITKLQLGPSYADDVAWMRGLPYFYETPDVRVVHAAMIPGTPLAGQPEEILCGSASGEAKLKARFPDGYWHEYYRDPLPIVFGHHVTGAEPLVHDNVYGIDTGACHGLRLTALSVPDFKLYSVPAREDHWATVARSYQVPVLRQRAWPTMSWRKIDETIADREGDSGPDCATYLAQLVAWKHAVRGLMPVMLERVRSLAATGVDPNTHAAKPLLHLHARNKLALADVEQRCPTPAATLALAGKLDVDTSSLPALP